MADDPHHNEDEQDPNDYHDSWAGMFDRILWSIGWAVTGAFVVYTALTLLGVPWESAAKLTWKLALGGAVFRYIAASAYD